MAIPCNAGLGSRRHRSYQPQVVQSDPLKYTNTIEAFSLTRCSTDAEHRYAVSDMPCFGGCVAELPKMVSRLTNPTGRILYATYVTL